MKQRGLKKQNRSCKPPRGRVERAGLKTKSHVGTFNEAGLPSTTLG